MPIIFTKEHIKMIIEDKKTMTRRIHRYALVAGNTYKVKINYYKFVEPELKIRVTRSFKQRLGDITPEDALKEGGYTVDQFREVWVRINGTWDPDLIVNVYEFKVIKHSNFL